MHDHRIIILCARHHYFSHVLRNILIFYSEILIALNVSLRHTRTKTYDLL